MRNYTILALCLWLMIAIAAMLAYSPDLSAGDVVCIAAQSLENGVHVTSPPKCFPIP